MMTQDSSDEQLSLGQHPAELGRPQQHQLTAADHTLAPPLPSPISSSTCLMQLTATYKNIFSKCAGFEFLKIFKFVEITHSPEVSCRTQLCSDLNTRLHVHFLKGFLPEKKPRAQELQSRKTRSSDYRFQRVRLGRRAEIAAERQ